MLKLLSKIFPFLAETFEARSLKAVEVFHKTKTDLVQINDELVEREAEIADQIAKLTTQAAAHNRQVISNIGIIEKIESIVG